MRRGGSLHRSAHDLSHDLGAVQSSWIERSSGRARDHCIQQAAPTRRSVGHRCRVRRRGRGRVRGCAAAPSAAGVSGVRLGHRRAAQLAARALDLAGVGLRHVAGDRALPAATPGLPALPPGRGGGRAVRAASGPVHPRLRGRRRMAGPALRQDLDHRACAGSTGAPSG
jgi:hypothetical protein